MGLGRSAGWLESDTVGREGKLKLERGKLKGESSASFQISASSFKIRVTSFSFPLSAFPEHALLHAHVHDLFADGEAGCGGR